MSFTITCPVCGKRDMYEFRFGNEDQGPAPEGQDLSPEDYSDQVHLHPAVAGPQKEWWCHRDGCGIWFTVWRDTLTGRQTEEPPSPEEENEAEAQE
ncbi:MAG: sarcosine oxidase subunit delta [Deltaproteobacteria bacterium]|nr:sarcosine oxidase subunit delta [Deltaproteobacteria bacterium]